MKGKELDCLVKATASESLNELKHNHREFVTIRPQQERLRRLRLLMRVISQRRGLMNGEMGRLIGRIKEETNP